MAAFHEPEECLRGHAAHFGQRLADGCQGRCDKGGRKAVIGTDHAHVHRHGLPSFAQRGVTAEGVNVVTGEDRRWWVREVEQGERLVVAVPRGRGAFSDPGLVNRGPCRLHGGPVAADTLGHAPVC